MFMTLAPPFKCKLVSYTCAYGYVYRHTMLHLWLGTPLHISHTCTYGYIYRHTMVHLSAGTSMRKDQVDIAYEYKLCYMYENILCCIYGYILCYIYGYILCYIYGYILPMLHQWEGTCAHTHDKAVSSFWNFHFCFGNRNTSEWMCQNFCGKKLKSVSGHTYLPTSHRRRIHHQTIWPRTYIRTSVQGTIQLNHQTCIPYFTSEFLGRYRIDGKVGCAIKIFGEFFGPFVLVIKWCMVLQRG